MIWQELVKTALLGLENGQLSPAVIKKLQEKGVKTEAEPAQVLLSGAALFWQMQKAGFLLPDFQGILPEPAEAADEDYCSAAAGFHLELMLNGFYKKALPEFFYLLQQNELALLPELLPALFKSCLRNKALWNLARPHIGARGAWLLHQNPDWQILLKREPENPEPFEYLKKAGTTNETDDELYLYHPDLLREILEYYQTNETRWNWRLENTMKIVTFRTNLLKAFEG